MDDDSLTTAESWDRIWSANRQHDVGVRSRLKAHRLWLRLLGTLLDAHGSTRSLDVLELGCAPGSMLLQLHRLRPQHRYRGLDISPAGLAITRRRLQRAGIFAELSLGDIRSAQVAPADLVMSFGLAEHFADPVEAIRYHSRFVRSGGMVAVTVPNYSQPAVVWALHRFSPETLETHNLALMSPATMRSALLQAGFTSVQGGEGGSATLPNSRPRPGLLGTTYRFVARTWNVGTTLLPECWPWSATVWGTGISPGEPE